mmetsp:Transcript_23201/g.75791  ORF Transcript_23201/g.75791 Transcript_23201/m.75791 type:complete len:246 (-) Transcript_23201:193-930(-)
MSHCPRASASRFARGNSRCRARRVVRPALHSPSRPPGLSRHPAPRRSSQGLGTARGLTARARIRHSPAEPLPASPPVVVPKHIAALRLRRRRPRPAAVEEVGEQGGRAEGVALHVLEEVVDVARQDADQVEDWRAAHEDAQRDEHPRPVEALDVEEAKDGEDGVGELARPDVDDGGEHGLREEGQAAEYIRHHRLHRAHDGHCPQEVSGAAFEPLGLELLGVAYEEEEAHHEGEREGAEEGEVCQ